MSTLEEGLSELPGAITADAVRSGVQSLLETQSWDTLTMKVVLANLEQQLLPQHPPGTLKPVKKAIKEVVDELMKKIMAEREAAATEPSTAAPEPEATANEAQETAVDGTEDAMDTEAKDEAVEEEAHEEEKDEREEEQEEVEAEEESAPAEPARPKKRRKIIEEEEDDDEEEEEDDAAGPSAATSGGAAASSEAGGVGGGVGDEDDDDLDDDPDAPKVAGKPTHKLDGKLFYTKLTKGDEEIHIGQDVYLENNLDVPYVARLQQIFVYSFAPSEVYFNARWYYRVGDVHEYARMSGAKADVEYEGETLEAHPKELFFSLHMDENHADCILRSCAVHILRTPQDPAVDIWEEVSASQHEYLAWRAYDNKHVYALTALPSKKLKDACDIEVKRGPQGLAARAAPAPRKKTPVVDTMPSGPLQAEELHAIWLPRKHLEVWLETNIFHKVVTGTLVRCSQLINNARTFYAAYVMSVKKMPRPYKLGQRMVEIALQVRTATGHRLIGLDALSNAPCTAAELERFRVPLDEGAVRKKIRSLQSAMHEQANLFEEEELRRRMEQDEQLREKREEEARRQAALEEERERKEREREEVRRRAAMNRVQERESEAWWLQYQNKDEGNKQREIAKLKARLLRFRKIAEGSTAEGERENALRLAEQAEAKLATLVEGEEDA